MVSSAPTFAVSIDLLVATKAWAPVRSDQVDTRGIAAALVCLGSALIDVWVGASEVVRCMNLKSTAYSCALKHRNCSLIG